jgi:geranylgeranyl diphosphate synthase type I
MIERIQSSRQEINGFLQEYIVENSQLVDNQWQDEIEERLLELVSEGKMVRGGLILETHDRFNGSSDSHHEVLKASAAIELAHTGLLIHDDIIDRDDERRRMRAIHMQYRDLGRERSVPDPEHYGDSMAICLADVAFFLAFRLMSDIQVEPERSRKASTLFWDYFSAVGMGEMMDIDSGSSPEELSEEEIMELYRNKTANYTFSLPMATGAILAGTPEEKVEELEKIGMKIGIIYQLRDDELGLFGETDELGKPLGSDLEEDKKTLHRLYLVESLDEERRKEVVEMMGEGITREEKTEILELMEEKGVSQKVEEKMDRINSELEQELESSDLPEGLEDDLRELATFSRERDL